MEVTGKLHAKFDTQDVSASFKKREFVLEIVENPQYPQFVTFQLVQDKCGLIDAFALGGEVVVSFNLRGRAWNSPQGETKYFNTLEAWRIAPANVAAGSNQPVVNAPSVPPVEGMDITQLNDSDDLPF
ncbi:MAG: DUF3127 domain-containing protein [Bacteroidia bacterium]|nr:DUF3127 domain-containing protein [Bacteroidia bacterium]